MPQLKNRIRFAIDCKSDPVFLYAGRSPSIMEIPKNSLSVNLTDGSALIYQALHLAKSLPFTDTSSKMRFAYGQTDKNGHFVRNLSEILAKIG